MKDGNGSAADPPGSGPKTAAGSWRPSGIALPDQCLARQRSAKRMRLVTWENNPARQIVWLHPPSRMGRHFPDRLRELRRSFVRFFRRVEVGAVDDILVHGGSVGVVLTNPLATRNLTRFERKLANRLLRPLSAGEAARFLGLDKKELREMRKCGRLTPCGCVAASRYGRAYSYAVFAVADLISLKDAAARLCAERSDGI